MSARLLLVLALALVLVLVLLAAAGAVVPGTARAELRFEPCDDAPTVGCATLVAPFDREASPPGELRLHVRRFPAPGQSKGTLILVPGGPGQSSSGVFDAFTLYWFSTLFGGYDTIAFDPRGTGRSEAIVCPDLQGASDADLPAIAPVVAACAERLGPARDLYTTLDHVDDLEAVRVGLAVERVAIAGFSWGGRVAQAYALRYPGHVERLLLDSPDQLDVSWLANGPGLRSMPRVLEELCTGLCRLRVPGFAARLVAVANRLGVRGEVGRVADGEGRLRPRRLRGVDLLGLVLTTDVNDAVRALLPDAVLAASRGDLAALLRLQAATEAGGSESVAELNATLFVATTCGDTAFPWAPDDPLAARRRLLARALFTLPDGTTAPFGRWAVGAQQELVARICLGWPGQPVEELAVGEGPDVPVLVIAGTRDLRTPIETSLEAAARFPGARLVEARGLGHTPLSPLEPCLAGAVETWLAGGLAPRACQRASAVVELPPPLPTLPRAARGGQLAAATADAVAATIADAEVARLVVLLEGVDAAVGGTRGGLLRPAERGRIRLVGYSVVPGVRVSGVLDVGGEAVSGEVVVRGERAADGRLELVDGRIQGRLGGVRVVLERELPVSEAARALGV